MPGEMSIATISLVSFILINRSYIRRKKDKSEVAKSVEQLKKN